MRELVLTPRFESAFRHVVGKNPAVRSQIETTLRRLAADSNDPHLKAHHLSGPLAGLHACTVNYDCRIVFSKQKDPKTNAEVLILVNIGSNDDMYFFINNSGTIAGLRTEFKISATTVRK